MPALPKIPRIQPWKTTAKGLVGCWPFFEGAGAVLHDISGYAIDGGPGGAFPAWVDDQPRLPAPGGALRFDGASTWVNAPGFPNLATAISVCVHFKISVLGAAGARLVAKWNGSVGWLLQAAFASSGPYYWYVATSNGTASVSAGTVDATADHWLAGTYDGVLMRLYLDGVLIGSAAQTGAIVASAQSLYFGTDENHTTGSQWLDGDLFEARVYNRALAPSEIWDIYAGGG